MAISEDFVEQRNAADAGALEEDFAALSGRLARREIDLDKVKERVKSFSLALPTWGVGRGGTRFSRFPMPGEPTNIHEKIEDCAVVNQLGRATPRLSPHFPWDKVEDYDALREEAAQYGLGFDAVNSNTFQDQPGQPHSYETGSLSSPDPAVRAQAVEHNIECIEIGARLGSSALTVWVGDGTNFPGQQDFRRSFDRYLEASAQIYAALPNDWTMLLEHKLFEPAFYSSVLPDWGSSILAAQQLGERCKCLVDLGHHAPSVNIEQIVSRLNQFGKLGGFHFNDSKYGDDDLDSGSIDPHQLFLVFNELVEAERNAGGGFAPAYMIDQSHNITDPIESLLSSVEAICTAYAKALLVDREALQAAQDSGDVMLAFRTLRTAYETGVEPLVATVRAEQGGAIDWLGTYRASGWRSDKARERRPAASGTGIV